MHYFRLLPLLLLGLLACQKPTIDPTDPDQPATGIPTEVGQPVGTLITKTIGPAGGTLATPDGRVTFTFPAGAISHETVITMQPVENKAFSGTGPGYAITPANLTLAKDAQVTWQYTPDDMEGSAPEALGLAYQDQNGIWQGRTDVTVDKAKQTATAPVSRLAHWSFYEQFYVETTKKILAPLEQATVTAYYHEGLGDDLVRTLVPLVPPKILSASRVVRWTINGKTDGSVEGDDFGNVGQITEDRTLAKASYAAPPREPDMNPVAVGVEIDLKQFGRVILAQHIRIESSASLNIGGSVDSNPNVGLTFMGNKLSGILNDRSGKMLLTFSIDHFTGKGTYAINEQHTVLITPAVAGRVPYLDSYYLNNQWISGGGTITITDYAGKDKPIAGRISGNFFWQKSIRDLETVPASARFRSVAVVVP